MVSEILCLRGVSYSYGHRRRQVNVLDGGVDIQVSPGERIALVGGSGSGKSTLLDLAAGIRQPSRGTVTLMGQDLGRLSSHERAALRLQHVARIFQDFKLLPTLDARDNVAVVARLRGEDASSARDRALQALVLVGLHHRSGHRPRELSGGEQQRVAIARAIVAQPNLLLADEPTGALDSSLRDEILSLILGELPSAAVLLVTHDPAVAERLERTVTLADGRFVA